MSCTTGFFTEERRRYTGVWTGGHETQLGGGLEMEWSGVDSSDIVHLLVLMVNGSGGGGY